MFLFRYLFPAFLAAPLAFGWAERPKPLDATEPISQLLQVGPDAAEAVKARSAVNSLVKVGPKALPAILAAVPERDVVKANWLRAAFERIVAEAAVGKQPLPVDDLLAFARDDRRTGRARRLALEAVEKVKPGTTARLLDGWLADPEFSGDAVAVRTEKAAALEKENKEGAIKLYREAFDASLDFQQSLALAFSLKALEVSVDPLPRLGVVRDWMVLGPFDDSDEKGYAKAYPPEKHIDLMASYGGKSGKVAWKKFTSEAPDGRVDLGKAVGKEEGAVAYAHAVLHSPREQVVEVRAGGDDNLAVWVNGKKVIDHPTYRSHLRIDWHRARVRLSAGENAVLVKVCQCPAPKEKAPGPPNKWEFHLRVVDAEGRGVASTEPKK
ncbi:MAG: hypothetical protein U0840_05880 [Gemmataceae bacterium]